MRTRHDVLYILGSTAWDTWIPSFLSFGDVNSAVLRAPHDFRDMLGGVSARNPACTIVLSHHETLLRDAVWAERLREEWQGNVVCQPLAVAELAFDKRRMAALTRYLPATLPIEPLKEFSAKEAQAHLERGAMAPFVVKRRAGTEGKGFRMVSSLEELLSALRECERSDAIVVQRFISGREFSVIVAAAGGNIAVFEPVDKGMTTVGSPHPSRRHRICPSRTLSNYLSSAMQDSACAMAEAIGLLGVAEFEFLEAEGTLYLVEVNPRVAATMRMVCLACSVSIFSELANAALGLFSGRKIVAANACSCEFPLPQRLYKLRDRGEISPGVWVTSRVTVAAPDAEALHKRAQVALAELERMSTAA